MLPKLTAACNILNHTPIYSVLHLASIVVYHHLYWQNMTTNRSPPKTANMAPLCGLCGMRQRREDNSEWSANSSWSSTGKDSRFPNHTNQYHPLHAYVDPPPQQPFPGTPQFHQNSPFNMTHSSQWTTSTRQGFRRCGPQWQEYDLHQGGWGESQMFTPLQIRGPGPAFPGPLRVPP